MKQTPESTNTPPRYQPLKRNIVAILVVATGLITISGILFSLFRFRHIDIDTPDAPLTLLAGLSLIYLATLLNRGKYNAWLVSVPIFGYLVIRNIRHFVFDLPSGRHLVVPTLLNLLLPIVTLLVLVYNRLLFNVRSEIRNFTTALIRSFLVLLVALVYGVIGFTLMDQHDFHQEISVPTATHYTVDQFGLTTSKQVVPYTKRSKVFVDSLEAISLGALFYVAASLFSPIRFRLSNHRQDYEDVGLILSNHSLSSEDFFMLWPPDKSYFFNHSRNAVVAYKAVHGVALIVGDPIGPNHDIRNLLIEFMGFCQINDWRPAFIHAEVKNLELYKELGFETQKIGEEAIIGTREFVNHVATSKDFRHIAAKFDKLGYRCDVLEPPHNEATISRLRSITKDWLKEPGRSERGFMMGYFDIPYLQKCKIIAAVDEQTKIQAFINQIPSPSVSEASFDFLRHSKGSPGNINDYLMLNFIRSLEQQKIPRLNMGLSPLSGLDEDKNSENRLLNGFLGFAYANGGRFYSFQGLKRFKAKYEPMWESRYIVYRGGIRGFSKTLNALMRAMRR